MCELNGERVVAGTLPSSAVEATDSVLSALTWLADADLASTPAAVQAECLRSLERVRSVFTAAHASVLSTFQAGGGYEDDGQGSARTWLRWQTQVTGTAASSATGWMRRLKAHEAVREALRCGGVSASWARQICDWTDQLPAEAREDADRILLGATSAGAELADLARLAEEMRRRLAPADEDGKQGFEDRQLRLQTTLGGAGRLDGDLTPRCAEAVKAVLEALGKRAGPEDTRTTRQRHHDALEEACRRLIAADGLPDRAGQPTQIQLHISLDDLTRRLNDGPPVGSTPGSHSPGDPARPSDSGAPSGLRGPRGTVRSSSPADLYDPAARPACLVPPGPVPPGSVPPGPVLAGSVAMPGDECDATIVPMVTGRVDHDLLDRLTALLTRRLPGCRDQVRELIVANAVALLSGPSGVASALRGRVNRSGPAVPVSLPLDVGKPTETIPPHLRRAVIVRDRHCAAPGCEQPPAGCQVHHVRPRSLGGGTSLNNLVLLCTFHHLIAVHQWGWTITLNPDGTTAMRSPDGGRVYRSHSPPAAAA